MMSIRKLLNEYLTKRLKKPCIFVTTFRWLSKRCCSAYSNKHPRYTHKLCPLSAVARWSTFHRSPNNKELSQLQQTSSWHRQSLHSVLWEGGPPSIEVRTTSSSANSNKHTPNIRKLSRLCALANGSTNCRRLGKQHLEWTSPWPPKFCKKFLIYGHIHCTIKTRKSIEC